MYFKNFIDRFLHRQISEYLSTVSLRTSHLFLKMEIQNHNLTHCQFTMSKNYSAQLHFITGSLSMASRVKRIGFVLIYCFHCLISTTLLNPSV